MRADILIVGDGVLGLSLAAALASRDTSLGVTVVAPRTMEASPASPAAGAMLNCFGEVTKYTLASAPGRAKFELLRSAAAAWPAWIELVQENAGGVSRLERHEGTTVVQNARGGHFDSENFAAFIAALEEFGEPFEEIEPDAIAGLDPVPDARPLRAVHLPREGWLDASVLLTALHAACANLGVRFIADTVAQLTEAGGRVTGCVTREGVSISAGTTVLATGVGTTELLDGLEAGERIQPVMSGCGLAVTLQRVAGVPISGAIRTVNRAGSCGLHVLPVAGGEYVGATNVIFRSPETRAWPAVCHFLLQCAMEQLDQSMAIARVGDWHLGNRPVSLDTFPLVGRCSVEGLYLLTGTYRDGLHCSPVLADVVASDLLEDRPALEGAFSPERKPISTLSVEQSIDEFVLQNISSGFESALTIPRFWNHRDLGRLFRPLAEAVYERLGIGWGLAPDIVGFLALSRKSESDVDDIATRLGRIAA
jgi:glycine oxidase